MAGAQSFPSKPVVLLVPQPAGGGADALCRSLQARLSQALGQPVIIDNRGGAAGNIGTAAGMAAPADGHTVTFVNLSTMALNPYLYAKTGYAVSDMQPVIWLTSVANLFVVNPDRVSATTMRDFIALARKEPGKYTYGTAGNGSGNHLGGEMLKSMAKIDLVHVPYRGGAPAITALLGGEIDSAVADPLAVMPHIKSGKLRALAVTSSKRAAALPDVPTIAESGVPGYEATSWAGIVVPKATSTDAVDRLYKAFAGALKAPEVAEKLSSQLYEPVGAGPVEFARFIAAENDKWSKLIKQLGVRID
ncbi:MAG TPA: tripartite tricarboxylate transporter substrate binding protein [Burkholderiaceae bacterium]|nr:tripartite tricarboxylate transporter substrate binding protein [Burkholderiaceae bacterium]